MILVCPNCSTRYSVSDAAVGPAGRQVKCTRCAHEWLQLPVKAADEPPAQQEPAPPPEAGVDTEARPPAAGMGGAQASVRTVPLPSATRSRSRGRAGLLLGWAALLLFVAALVAGILLGRDRILEQWPATARLYEGLGLAAAPSGAGLEFRSVSPDWRPGENGTALVIAGEIGNAGQSPQAVPPVRVVLRDAAEAELQTETVDLDVDQLGPGESAPFRIQLERANPGAAGVALFFAPADAHR